MLNVAFSSVLQLVKSQKTPAKLAIAVETEKEKILRKEFVFDDTKVIIPVSKMVVASSYFTLSHLEDVMLFSCHSRKEKASVSCFNK